MRIVIEFYRTRARDSAHALLGREAAEVVDLDAAIELARSLARTLNMPQRPDALTITGADGVVLHACAFDTVQGQQDEPS
ncbi:hypothetical protein KHC23_14210 [Ancylobacter dichloromethanicus]|uniref:hypothetical protein n=1 Tax=Ancylobacter dichloromethanicus TaxID=518825 RepID=UPI001BCADFE6|nr:hypothetical protein [Ancylobacter dichloromethanicus]MBS7554803.1 hypothetical protein [Ancylobacter dichloromethanicus]